MTQTPPPYYAAPAAQASTNVLAIISLVISFFIAPAGIVTGHIALNQIKKTGEQGHGLALAGTIIGYVLTALAIIGIVIYVVVIAIVVGTVGTHGGFTTGGNY